MKYAAICLTLLLFLGISMPAHADDTLPNSVRTMLHALLAKVGSGTYRRFGFKVYVASLWAPNGIFDLKKPYALQLRYTRSVSKDTLVDTVIDNIRDENVTDDATLAGWQKILNDALPDVGDGDTIIGLAQPGKPSELFYNGKKVASISDQKFSNAFFSIWLGSTADDDMRMALMGKQND